MPNFEIGAGAWILAGGTHHSCFSYDLTAEYWQDYAEIAGIDSNIIQHLIDHMPYPLYRYRIPLK